MWVIQTVKHFLGPQKTVCGKKGREGVHAQGQEDWAAGASKEATAASPQSCVSGHSQHPGRTHMPGTIHLCS